jgi:hypothetical protein
MSKDLENSMRVLLRGRAELARLREKLKVLERAVNDAETAVWKQLRELPDGTTVRIPMQELGRVYHLAAKEHVVWNPTSWTEVYDYIRKTDDFGILARRLNNTAAEELATKNKVPWLTPFAKPVLSVRSTALIAEPSAQG